ncbi:MAG: GNAT family N-acetyltransferase [Pyrinomonadaceae bacterium]|nr:GNAT family N-acetyltransferase [Pyrinomonadaceae bacterium]
MIEIREAEETDAEGIRDLFVAAYGEHYAYPAFYDLRILKKMGFEDETLLLVALDTKTDRILGTASVIFDLGEYGDLVGEFGRLVVHPDGRNRGIGNKLMNARLEHAQDRLHLGFAENRVSHPFSQMISHRYGFASAGFLPQKHSFEVRESLAIYVRHFGDALKLRRNNPHIISEGFLLAQKVLTSCNIEPDCILDDNSPGYPDESDFEIEEMTTKGYAPLLRFERARANQKEIFGPARIHQGLFRLKASHSQYVIASKDGQMVGAIGYATDETEKTATIFEIVSLDKRPIRHLIKEVINKCRRDFDLQYIETDVSAYSPSMQKTLLELGFMPVGYLPAFTFQGAERCDAMRMARLFTPIDMSNVKLFDATKPIAEIVLQGFSARDILPRLGEALPNIYLFEGLTDEQVRRLAEICTLEKYEKEKEIVAAGQKSERAFIVLDGELEVLAGNDDAARTLGVIESGECLGETSLLSQKPHSVSAKTTKRTEAAVIKREDLVELIRRRPDIGVVLYKNLAESLGNKLRDIDAKLARQDDD